MVVGKRILIAFLLLLSLSSWLFAQAEPVPRRILLIAGPTDAASYPGDVSAVLNESLIARLASLLPEMLFIMPSDASVDANADEMPTLAREHHCDAWLRITWSGTPDSTDFSVVSWDLAESEQTFSEEYTVRVDRYFRNVDSAVWGPVVADLSATYHAYVFSTNVRVFGIPGSTVIGLARDPVLIPAAGMLEIEHDYPATVDMEVRKKGVYPQHIVVPTTAEPVDVYLNQNVRSPFVWNFYLHSMSYPGIDISYMFVPEYGYVRFGFWTYAIGFVPLANTRNSANQLTVSAGLSVFHLSIGSYVTGTQVLMRPYVNAGAFLRVVQAAGMWAIEPITPWGGELTLGVEANPEGRFRPFFEYDPVWYYVAEPDVLTQQFADRDQYTIIRIGDSYIDPFSFRLGIRIQP